MLDLIVKDGVARGIVARDMVTGQIRPYTAHAVVLATGGYGNVFGKSTTCDELQRHRGVSRASPRRVLRFAVFHPVPSHDPADQFTVAVQADADERVAAQRRTHVGAHEEG